MTDAPIDDRPLRRPYWRIERERRFALDQLPMSVDPESFERLRDCFVAGTHLRLRRVEAPDGTTLAVKLGQKIPDPAAPDDPRHRQMTTIYLPESEANALALDGPRSTKRRYKLSEQGRTFCIDVWEEPQRVAGLVVAEVECDTDDALDGVQCPTWARREVTGDDDYSAWRLAAGLSSVTTSG